MKRIMLIAAIACMALVSCTKEELEPNANEGNVIGFSAYSGRNVTGTKAVTDLNTLKVTSVGFNLFAYYTGQQTMEDAKTTATPNYMYKQNVTWTPAGESGTWTYSPLKYWPNADNDKISFFGYLNTTGVTVTSANTATGYPTVNFTQDANNSIDFVVAKTLDQNKMDNAVSLNFKHALTRVRFSAKIGETIIGTGDDTKVFITGITVEGSTPAFYTKGVFTYSNNDTYCGSWSNQENPAALSISLNKETQDWGGYTTESVALNQDASAVSLLDNADGYMFLVPNNQIGLVSDLSLKVDYDIVTKDPAINGGHTLAHNSVSATLAAGTLQQGKAYGYTFTLELKSIKVEATEVAGWGTEE